MKFLLHIGHICKCSGWNSSSRGLTHHFHSILEILMFTGFAPFVILLYHVAHFRTMIYKELLSMYIIYPCGKSSAIPWSISSTQWECPFNKQEFYKKQLFRLAIVGHAHYMPNLTGAFCMRDYRLWRTACFRSSCEIRKEKGENSVYRTKRKRILITDLT